MTGDTLSYYLELPAEVEALQTKLNTALDQFADLRKLYEAKCEECERLKKQVEVLNATVILGTLY